jgi:hypothetical protein
MKEYLKKDFESLDYLYDEFIDEYEIGHVEEFIYDGKIYKGEVKHDGTYLEYGVKGTEVIFTEINGE